MGQSAAKHPEMDEGSSTIPKGSRTPSGSEAVSPSHEGEDIVSALWKHSEGVLAHLLTVAP